MSAQNLCLEAMITQSLVAVAMLAWSSPELVLVCGVHFCIVGGDACAKLGAHPSSCWRVGRFIVAVDACAKLGAHPSTCWCVRCFACIYRNSAHSRRSVSQSSQMPLTIEHHVAIRMGGRAEWKVRSSLLLEVNGDRFIKLPASEGGFIKLVCDGQIDGAVPRNASLSHSAGLRELIELRNMKQSEELAMASDKANVCALFGPPPEQALQPARRQRRTLREVREARESPEVFELDVPGHGDRASMRVRMIRPVNPRDDLCVTLLAEAVEHIVLFIRNAGIDRATLEHKRTYKSAGHDTPKGIWSSGKGYVVKVPAALQGELSAKYKRVKSMDAALGVFAGTEAHMDVILDADVDAQSGASAEQSNVAGALLDGGGGDGQSSEQDDDAGEERSPSEQDDDAGEEPMQSNR